MRISWVVNVALLLILFAGSARAGEGPGPRFQCLDSYTHLYSATYAGLSDRPKSVNEELWGRIVRYKEARDQAMEQERRASMVPAFASAAREELENQWALEDRRLLADYNRYLSQHAQLTPEECLLILRTIPRGWRIGQPGKDSHYMSQILPAMKARMGVALELPNAHDEFAGLDVWVLWQALRKTRRTGASAPAEQLERFSPAWEEIKATVNEILDRSHTTFVTENFPLRNHLNAFNVFSDPVNMEPSHRIDPKQSEAFRNYFLELARDAFSR